MKLNNNPILWLCITVTLFQFTSSESRDAILSLQLKVERLIEHVLQLVHNFYSQLKTEHKCIPEDLPDKIMTALKNSIDCIDEIEKNHQSALLARRAHHKHFLKCFTEAKREVHDIMSEIDLERNYCPENMTEKTYQINVTTSYTKRFKINIKNGLEVSKVIESTNPEHELCLDDDHHDDDYEDEEETSSENDQEQDLDDGEIHHKDDHDRTEPNEGEEEEEGEDEEESEDEGEGEDEEDEGEETEDDSERSNKDHILGLSSVVDDEIDNEDVQEREEYAKNDKTNGYFGKSSKRKHDGGAKTGNRDLSSRASETGKLSALSLEVPMGQMSSI